MNWSERKDDFQTPTATTLPSSLCKTSLFQPHPLLDLDLGLDLFLKPKHKNTDYLTKVVVQGKQSSSLHVREIMTARSKLLTVPPQVREKRERERERGKVLG